jgi:sigma-B regulation protein RsbU (phosphoserine phosphatase)
VGWGVGRVRHVAPRQHGLEKGAGDRLRDIEAVTGARLAHLDVEELLVELLDRVRDVLAADTAVVLLLDEPTGELVATAARGIEEEVYQAARVPVGRGFAGRIAATKQPAAIEDIADADVVNPVLRESGIRSLLGVPLLVEGRLLGVLHVGTVRRRRFDDNDVDLLQMVADRVALATQASLSESERNASVVLQRSLLPDALPRIQGLEAAFRYIAGAGGSVGGDWYDLFVLPSGGICASVGDVVGKGLRAAVVMGRIRSALRAHSLAHQGDPRAVLDMVDHQLRHFDPDAMATAIVAVIDPSLDRLHLAIAGHPAPVMAVPGEPGRYLDLPVGPPLGVPGTWSRPVTTVDLPPGAAVCFYTDGLIERRGTKLTARLARLCETVTAAAPEQVCTSVMLRMVGFERPTDDIAVLALRRT